MTDFYENNIDNKDQEAKADKGGYKPHCERPLSKTLPLCDGNNVEPKGVNGPLVAKIPVVLAEKDIQIDTEACIKMPCRDYEIKRITKDVYLTQCKLLPLAGKIENGKLMTGKLCISGYVLKNMEYVPSGHCGYSQVLDKTDKIPFNCITEVAYVRSPQIRVRKNSNQVDYLCSNMKCDCTDPNQYMGKNPFENEFIETVAFNEEPFCELEKSKIISADIQKAPYFTPNHLADEKNEKGCMPFSILTEKMVIYIRVKVLQLQQVNIGC